MKLQEAGSEPTGIIHIARRVPMWRDCVHTICGRVLPLVRHKEFQGKLTRCPECAAMLEKQWDRAVIEHA